jgi:hypothetical protein
MKHGKDMLLIAAETVTERGKIYGPPNDDMVRIAALWSAILGTTVAANQVPMCMVALKLARLITSPNHIDSVVDIAGWAAVLREIQAGRD